jgi:hypothetical protein
MRARPSAVPTTARGDDENRDEQQTEVRAREGVGDVVLEADGSGQARLEPVGQPGRGEVAEVLGRSRHVVLDDRGVERDRDEGGAPVVAHLRSDGLRGGGGLGQGGGPLAHGGHVVVGEVGTVAAPHDDAEGPVRRGEVLEPVGDAGGLGRIGQAGAREGVRFGRRDDREEEPDHGDGRRQRDPRGDASAQESGDGSHETAPILCYYQMI